MNKWLNRTANLFLLVLCMLSLLGLIQGSFPLTIESGACAWLVLLCVLVWAAVFFRRAFFPGLLAAGVVLWVLIRRHADKLRPQLLDIVQAVRLSWLNSFINEGGGAVFRPVAEDHTLALLLILFVAAAYLAIVLSGGSYRVNLSLLLTLPAAALCLAVNRDPPVLPLLGLVLFWAELLISGDAYRPNDSAGRTVLLTLLPCLAVLGVSLLFNRPSEYQPDDKAQKLIQRFEDLSRSVSSYLDKRQGIPQMLQGIGHWSDSRSGWDQGNDTLDLTRPYDFSAGGHEVLTFRGNADGSLYLRGRSFGDYTGSAWSKAAENPDSQALNFAAYSTVMAGYTGSGTVLSCSFEIQTDRAYDTLYLPYFTVSATPGESLIPADGKTAYNGEYFLLNGGSFGPLPDSLRQEERQYRSFAEEYYTRLPESTRDALTALARQNGLNAEADSILTDVVEYVCRGSTYDLSVGPYPGDDCALYFLQNARRGYCIHYATAACCLYRALGFPARVCEGFLIMARAGSDTIVRASDAHAWVEVWLDGIGWLPVEVTYGGSDAEDGSGAPISPEAETPRPESETEHDAPPEADATPVPDQRTEITPDGSSDAEGADTGSHPTDPENSGAGTDRVDENAPPAQTRKPTDKPGDDLNKQPDQPRKYRLALIVLGVLAALALAVVTPYYLLRRRLQRWLSEPDGRRRAVCLYRQAKRVLRFGGEMPKAVQTAAEKASFSPHSISEEELQRSLDALNELTEQVYRRLSPLRRLVFRYRLGL